jgi:hypothetical protein
MNTWLPAAWFFYSSILSLFWFCIHLFESGISRFEGLYWNLEENWYNI